MPAQAGIQGFQLNILWIALTLHCVSRLRGNDEALGINSPTLELITAVLQVLGYLLNAAKNRKLPATVLTRPLETLTPWNLVFSIPFGDKQSFKKGLQQI